MSESSQPPSNPVFVVGVFRSGTSLLYSLLNRHPQVALMYECDVWDFPSAIARQRFSGNWLERQEFYNQTLSRHRLIFGGRLNGLENIRTPEDLYRCHGETQDARLWGEKSPVYATRLARLAKKYPNGSFILIWRDPLAIYSSVLRAGKTTAFFRRPGMLHRMIFHQEKMIREAGLLQQAGTRIHHIRYDDLVDRTEATCRATCQFLGIPFTEAMLNLEHADFSAIYQEPQHEFLRRGVIERQNISGDAVPPAAVAKLRRFCQRWERLSGQRFGFKQQTVAGPEVSAVERMYHHLVGVFLFAAENTKRLVFEFLPMPWLRTYRLFKNWMFSRNLPANAVSFKDQLRQNGITIYGSFLLWTVIVCLDLLTGPEITLGPLYLIPCAALALVVGRGWASVIAVLNALALTAERFSDAKMQHFDCLMMVVLVWNLFMRFIFFQIFVLLLDRIRVEIATRNDAAPVASPAASPKV